MWVLCQSMSITLQQNWSFFCPAKEKDRESNRFQLVFTIFATLSLSYLILYSAFSNNKQTGYSHYSSIDVWSRGVKGKGKPNSLSFLFLMNCLLFIIYFYCNFNLLYQICPYISIQLVSHVTFPYALQFLKLSIFASRCAHIKHNKFVWFQKF